MRSETWEAAESHLQFALTAGNRAPPVAGPNQFPQLRGCDGPHHWCQWSVQFEFVSHLQPPRKPCQAQPRTPQQPSRNPPPPSNPSRSL